MWLFKKLGINEKALIFTESTRTQQYLCEILGKTKYKDKIVLFNGSNNDEKSKIIYIKKNLYVYQLPSLYVNIRFLY